MHPQETFTLHDFSKSYRRIREMDAKKRHLEIRTQVTW
ncbi:MAG: hypothetical protein N838_04880 [Thiohalocapsa sp. PB-PSB1]|nr:MAG: hypothetical protein N838_04880 [Thiohalocapsa sp. PB-PSB1]